METLKKIAKAVLFPHAAIVVLLVPVAAALLIYSFVFLEGQTIVSYVSYALSAYALTLLCVRTPRMIAFFENLRQENRYIHRYLTDAHLRVNISLYSSFIINVAYAIFQLGLGFYHRSVWFYSLAVYYILLAVMRFFLLKHTRSHEAGKDKKLELLIYRFCGMLLLLMNGALSAIVFYITWQGRTFVHHEITTIAMAAYTFTSLTMAIRNVVKYRKYESPVFSAAKVVSLAAAMVSMLTLESAMLTAFGEEGQEQFSSIMTGVTGTGVTVLILTIAIYMIVTSTKKIRSIQE